MNLNMFGRYGIIGTQYVLGALFRINAMPASGRARRYGGQSTIYAAIKGNCLSVARFMPHALHHRPDDSFFFTSLFMR